MNEDIGPFQCPSCGKWSDDQSLIHKTPPEYDYSKSMEFGVTAYNWIEIHRCITCNKRWEFENSNC